MLFSQRKGLTPVRKAIQRESVDIELRNLLWSTISIIFSLWESYAYGWTSNSEEINTLLRRYWLGFFKWPADTQPGFDGTVQEMRAQFFKFEWNQVLDFVEFTAKSLQTMSEPFCEQVNQYLEQENSAYRFISGEIVEITDENEISAIEEGIKKGPKAVSEHLNVSLRLLSDRKKPDYRNSVKESISAVEAACRLISGDEKATLGEALKILSAKAPLHSAFKNALSGLYGFTSDEQGIRHSLLEESSISYSDAKFMLVVCAAFCSFLAGKRAENGMK